MNKQDRKLKKEKIDKYIKKQKANKKIRQEFREDIDK